MGFLTDNFDRINVKNQLSMINDQFMQGVGSNAKKNLERINVKDQLSMINSCRVLGVMQRKSWTGFRDCRISTKIKRKDEI